MRLIEWINRREVTFFLAAAGAVAFTGLVGC